MLPLRRQEKFQGVGIILAVLTVPSMVGWMDSSQSPLMGNGDDGLGHYTCVSYQES